VKLYSGVFKIYKSGNQIINNQKYVKFNDDAMHLKPACD
jgi:hypothetical protein